MTRDYIFGNQLKDLLVAYPSMSDKDMRAIKSSLQIVFDNLSTFVIALAVHQDMSNNQIIKLKCENGNPIGGYVYDHVNRCYYVRGIEFCILGYIPISCYLKIKSNSYWRARIPLVESVICRHLTESGLAKLKSFKNRYKGDEYYFQYIQMVD